MKRMLAMFFLSHLAAISYAKEHAASSGALFV